MPNLFTDSPKDWMYMGNPGTYRTLRTERTSTALDVTQPPPRSGAFPIQASQDATAILLVARDYELDDACRGALVDAGYSFIFSVSDCDRALELIGSKLFDVVIVGIGAGDVQAISLAQRLHRHFWDVPTLIVSSFQGVPNANVSGETVAEANCLDDVNSLGQAVRELVSVRDSG